MYTYFQVTLEEQMICGALQTLNEEAFEDVIGSERPSPTGGPPSGEMFAHQLEPIREITENGYSPRESTCPPHCGFSMQDHHLQQTHYNVNCLNNNNLSSGHSHSPLPTVIIMPAADQIDDTPLWLSVYIVR